MKTSSKNLLSFVSTEIIMVLLAILMALSYQLFVVENHFAPAGLNGVATMVQYKTGFSIGYMSLIINTPLCIFAFFFVNRRFAISTLTFCLVYSFAFLFFQELGLEQFQYDAGGHNTIFPVILSGMISGFIYGICFLKNASTGGTDIVSKFISRVNPHINFFWATFILNACVAIVSFFVYAVPDESDMLTYDYSPVCLCILYCFLSSFMGNFIIKGTKSAVKFTIITEHPQEIAEEISRELKHGSTQLEALGTFRYESKSILLCVVNKNQMIDLKNILNKYPNTFSFSEAVNETYGNFKKIR